MARRTRTSVAALLALALCPVRAVPAQASSTRAAFVPISSYDDDPFAADSVLERLARWTFGSEEDGGLVLATPVVDLEDESRIYRADPHGRVKAEARVLRGDGLDAYVEVFRVDHPEGERREVLLPPVPAEQQVPIPEDVLD